MKSLEVSLEDVSISLRPTVNGVVGEFEYYPLSNVLSINSVYQEDAGSISPISSQKAQKYEFNDMLIVAISWGTEDDTDINFDIQSVTNQPSWTFDEAGLAKAIADISSWIDSDAPDVDPNPISELITRAYEEGEYVEYIIIGDSTRRLDDGKHMFYYYQAMLEQIGVTALLNSQAGESADRWLNNISGGDGGLARFLTLCTGTGENSIVEFSLGINDYSTLGGDLVLIKAGLKSAIDKIYIDRPNVKLLLVSPVCSVNYSRTTMLLGIYEELAVEYNLPLINGYDLTYVPFNTIIPGGENAYYEEYIHINNNGRRRVVNSIMNEVVPPELSFAMQMLEYRFIDNPQPILKNKAIVQNALYDIGSGTAVFNSIFRSFEPIDVSRFELIRVSNPGVLNQFIFVRNDDTFYVEEYEPFHDSEPYWDIVVPSDVKQLKINCTKTNITSIRFDLALSHSPAEAIQMIDPDSLNDESLTVERINVGLDLRLRTALENDIDDSLSNRVIVKKASDFGIIDPTKEYFIDGVIDMGNTSIEVPAGGIRIRGYNFDISGLTSSQDNFTLFTSPAGGSGNILFFDFYIDINGTNSSVYDIVSDTGFEAIEVVRINYNNCSSLGNIDNYRQGLESGTGRFGGTPELTLSGSWLGGFIIDVSIVRSLIDGSYSLFKAGVGFLMTSRFRTNINVDLNTTISLLDFSSSNFVNPSTLQLNGCIISRNGLFESLDTTIAPNITSSDLKSYWRSNKGISNTFVGGQQSVTTEVATTIVTDSVFTDLLGTFTTSDLQHFDSPLNGQLRNLGDSPIEFKLIADFILDSSDGDELELKVVIWDDSASAFIDGKSITRVVNNLQGGRDVAFITIIDNIILDQNDYVKLQVANISATNNITAELGSELIIQQR